MNSFHWQLWKDGKHTQLRNKSKLDHVLNTNLMNINLILLYDEHILIIFKTNSFADLDLKSS